MNISEKAVRAAYRASGSHHLTLDDMEAVLEAAAPFIAAQAWDEGLWAQQYNQEACENTPLGMTPKRKTNPYREACK